MPQIEPENQNQVAPTAPEPRSARPLQLRPLSSDEEIDLLPHLLAQLEDELARSRRREAFWISVIVHIALVLLVIFSPQLLPNWAQPHLLRAEDLVRGKEPTYLELPSDAQKPPEKVKSDRLSDKNRQAQTSRPQIDPKTLEALREAARLRGNQTAPGEAHPAPQQAMPQGAQPTPSFQQQQQWAMNNQPATRVQPPPEETPKANPFRLPGSAGAAIAQATRNAAHGGPIGAGGAGLGMGATDRNARLGAFDVLSDTQGVDFGPYLSRVIQSIKGNWYNLIPEEARAPMLKHGKVAVRFLIMPNGKVAGMFIETPSGDVPLDRAAYGGITASDPFSPLPREFHGPYLALRITFFYNPTTGELEGYQ